MTRGALHHIEIWVPDLNRAIRSWGWMLESLGYVAFQNWDRGRSWRCGDTYIVIEESPAQIPGGHNRLAPGVNHLAFDSGTRTETDLLVIAAVEHGWSVLFGDRHPFAGGPDHYAAYLESDDGYEIELVAH